MRVEYFLSMANGWVKYKKLPFSSGLNTEYKKIYIAEGYAYKKLGSR